MQRRKMKKFSLRRYIPSKDNEGNVIETYDDAIEDMAIIWPASGRTQAMTYGLRLNYMINLNYYGALEMKENDGLCINVEKTEEPDYKIVSIREYPKFKVIEAEKRIV